jgi:hypothetical protein
MSSAAFQHRGHHLLHAECPSPFKCSYTDSEPYVKCEPVDSAARRSHIDCVLVNPRFVDWHLDNKRDIKELIGIENERFSLYIKDLYDAYGRFNRGTGETILLYAVEFKFLRHSYEGPTYPIREIHRDCAKLRLLREFGQDLPGRIRFVERTKVVIFVGERMQKAREAIRGAMAGYDPAEYDVITRKLQLSTLLDR